MTNVTTNRVSDSGTGQSVDRSLLEYLKPKPEERFSKLEAYCDLLSRASSGAYTAATGDHKVELLPGQFVASISELARKWKWQRATVRQFLEGLEALGQISSKPFVKSFIFSVNLQQRLSLYVDSADDILDFCCMQFIRYVQGRTSAREVADSYGRYYGMRMDVAKAEGDGGIPVRRVLEHQPVMFNELASMLFQLLNCDRSVPQELSDSVSLLFGKDHIWNWQKVIESLGILAIGLRDNVKPSYMAELENRYSKAEITLLDCIFEHYASDESSHYYSNPPKPSMKVSGVVSAHNPAVVPGTIPDDDTSAEGVPVEKANVLSEGETLRPDSAEGNKEQ